MTARSIASIIAQGLTTIVAETDEGRTIGLSYEEIQHLIWAERPDLAGTTSPISWYSNEMRNDKKGHQKRLFKHAATAHGVDVDDVHLPQVRPVGKGRAKTTTVKVESASPVAPMTEAETLALLGDGYDALEPKTGELHFLQPTSKGRGKKTAA